MDFVGQVRGVCSRCCSENRTRETICPIPSLAEPEEERDDYGNDPNLLLSPSALGFSSPAAPHAKEGDSTELCKTPRSARELPKLAVDTAHNLDRLSCNDKEALVDKNQAAILAPRKDEPGPPLQPWPRVNAPKYANHGVRLLRRTGYWDDLEEQEEMLDSGLVSSVVTATSRSQGSDPAPHSDELASITSVPRAPVSKLFQMLPRMAPTGILRASKSEVPALGESEGYAGAEGAGGEGPEDAAWRKQLRFDIPKTEASGSEAQVLWHLLPEPTSPASTAGTDTGGAAALRRRRKTPKPRYYAAEAGDEEEEQEADAVMTGSEVFSGG